MKKLSKDDLKLKGQVVTGLTDGVILECQDSSKWRLLYQRH